MATYTIISEDGDTPDGRKLLTIDVAVTLEQDGDPLSYQQQVAMPADPAEQATALQAYADEYETEIRKNPPVNVVDGQPLGVQEPPVEE